MSSDAYRRYVLGVLTAVFTLNNVDRALLSLLLQPIKEDLHLSDTQLGFVTGMAFALLYATLGLPVARWSDRGDRSTIAAVAIGLWGVTVMGCLFVGNFLQLSIARIAAGIGEAGCMPPTYSLLGDYFPKPAERARAMAVYWLGNPLSGVFGLILGGWLNTIVGWRMTFFIMGLPAVLVALLVKVTVLEPRALISRVSIATDREQRIVDVIRTLWRQRSSRHLVIALVLYFTMAFGLSPWYAAFMMRSHGMNTADLGAVFGLIVVGGGTFGTLLGGYVAARWFAEDDRSQVRLSAVSLVLVVPCLAAFLLLPQKGYALLAFAPVVVVLTFLYGPTFALLQRLVRNEIRATTLAIVMLLSNLVGIGIGPQLVGITSDLLQPSLGDDALRYAMLLMSVVALLAAYYLWQVGRTVKRDLKAVFDEVRGHSSAVVPRAHRSDLVSN